MSSELKPGDKANWNDGENLGCVTVEREPTPRGKILVSDDDGELYLAKRNELTPIPPQPEVVRVAVGAKSDNSEVTHRCAYVEGGGLFDAASPHWKQYDLLPRTEITINPATGAVVGPQQEWVGKVREQINTPAPPVPPDILRTAPDKYGPIRGAYSSGWYNAMAQIADLIPTDTASGDAAQQAIDDLKSQRSIPLRHLHTPMSATDTASGGSYPQWLDAARDAWIQDGNHQDDGWMFDPDLARITLPTDEQLKKWGVRVVGFKLVEENDLMVLGCATRFRRSPLDYGGSEAANGKRLIVEAAKPDAKDDNPFDRVQSPSPTFTPIDMDTLYGWECAGCGGEFTDDVKTCPNCEKQDPKEPQ